jgi:hypothetical protein
MRFIEPYVGHESWCLFRFLIIFLVHAAAKKGWKHVKAGAKASAKAIGKAGKSAGKSVARGIQSVSDLSDEEIKKLGKDSLEIGMAGLSVIPVARGALALKTAAKTASLSGAKLGAKGAAKAFFRPGTVSKSVMYRDPLTRKLKLKGSSLDGSLIDGKKLVKSRQKLHNKVAARELAKAKAVEAPVINVISGGMGSGKSFIRYYYYYYF